MELNVSDFVEAVSELVKHGYDREYRKDGTIRKLDIGAPIRPGIFRLTRRSGSRVHRSPGTAQMSMPFRIEQLLRRGC